MSEPLYSSTAVDGWNLLPLDIKQQFYNIASKGEWTAQEAFVHLVPEELRDSPEKVELFMDGGTITTDQWVYDRGRAGGHYETVEHQIADKDVSRIEAGGEYSPDNTIMENASINRSRQAADMTVDEYNQTVADNAAEVDLIETSAIDSAADATVTATEEAVSSGADLLTETLGSVAQVAAAGFIGYKVGKCIHDRTSHMSDDDRTLLTALGGGGAAVLVFTPPGALAATVYGSWQLMKLSYKATMWTMRRGIVA